MSYHSELDAAMRGSLAVRTYADMRADCIRYARQASEHGYEAQVIHWAAAMDNYEPARDITSGHAVRYSGTLVRPDGSRAEYPTAGIYMPCDDANAIALGNAIRAIALFDDGGTVAPYYCAGHNPYVTDLQRRGDYHFGATGPYVLWHPFPLSEGIRADGHAVDMSGWMLGPRKAYHFKVTPLEENGPPGNPRALGEYDNGPVTSA